MAGGAMTGFGYGYQLYQGQRFASPTSDAWNPIAIGPVRSTLPAPIPVAAPMNSGPGLGTYDVGAGAKATGGASVLGIPVLVIVALAASLLLLRYVHFKG